ncbi:MAG: DUF1194 domain-containing protein [Rhizobiaceae bacterium]|nr:DUF1194 domain-containing protein [Rhizobiaceae bacterium]
MNRIVFLLVLLTTLTCALPHAQASEVEVDVELVLAVDVSRSMTPNELEIQRRGYAEAIVSDPVINAIRQGLLGQIAITYVEWAGTVSQNIIIDWTLISNRSEAEAFAARLTAQFENSMRRTSISGAMDFSSRLFEDNTYISNRQVIDISGDGPNNNGRPVLAARADTLARGIVINGLPLMTREGMGSQWHLEDLDVYYRHCVIGGPGSFVIPVLEWAQFPAAVRQKLVLELAGREQAPQKAAHQKAAHQKTVRARDLVMKTAMQADYDCMVGEKIWNSMRDLWSDQ